MSPKIIKKIGYFSLPEGTPEDFPKTFLILDEDEKVRVGDISREEMPYHCFARFLARGSIALTEEGEEFVKKAIKEGKL